MQPSAVLARQPGVSMPGIAWGVHQPQQQHQHQQQQQQQAATASFSGSQTRSCSQNSQGHRRELLTARIPHAHSLQRLQDRGSPSPRPQTSRRASSYMHLQSAVAHPLSIGVKATMQHDLSQDEASMHSLRHSLLQHIQTVQKEITRLQQERQRGQPGYQDTTQSCPSMEPVTMPTARRPQAASAAPHVLYSPQVLHRPVSRERERSADLFGSMSRQAAPLASSRHSCGSPVSTKTTATTTALAAHAAAVVLCSPGGGGKSAGPPPVVKPYRDQLDSTTVRCPQQQAHHVQHGAAQQVRGSGGQLQPQSALETPRLNTRALNPGVASFDSRAIGKAGGGGGGGGGFTARSMAHSGGGGGDAAAGGFLLGAEERSSVDVVAAVRAAAACRIQQAWRVFVSRRASACFQQHGPRDQRRAKSEPRARGPLPAVHWAAGRIQRAWKIYRWRRRFVDFSESQLNWVGSLEWLQRHNMLYGTELADNEDVRWWLQHRTSAPLDREVDPWGAERLLEHLNRMWYGGQPEQPRQQQQQQQQQQQLLEQQQQQMQQQTQVQSGRHQEYSRSRAREHRYSFSYIGEESNASFHQYTGASASQWSAKQSSTRSAAVLGSTTHHAGSLRSPASGDRAGIGAAHHAASQRQLRATSMSPRQEALQWAARPSAVLAAPPPAAAAAASAAGGLQKTASAGFRVPSASPPQTQRQPRATVAGCTLGVMQLRPRSPLQSARSHAGTTPLTSRLSATGGNGGLQSARSLSSAQRASAGISRTLSGSPPLVMAAAANSPPPASARR